MLICEAAAEYKKNGKTLYDGLLELFEKYGYCMQKLETLTLKGIDGADKIHGIMHKLRNEGIPITTEQMVDYRNGADGLPKADVLKFVLPSGWIAIRPSGTEPKIKFYFEVFADSLEKAYAGLDDLSGQIMGFIR